jgi:hypothetical protein
MGRYLESRACAARAEAPVGAAANAGHQRGDNALSAADARKRNGTTVVGSGAANLDIADGHPHTDVARALSQTVTRGSSTV